MNTNKKIYFLLILAVNLLTADAVYSQNHKKIDSILKHASNQIYANPDKVIKLGNYVVKQAQDNVEYKIKAYNLISVAYSSKRDYKKALEFLNKASELVDETDDKLLKINIVNKSGILNHQLKVYDKAIQYLDQAEQLIAEYPYKDSIHTELGKNYIVRGFIYKEKLSCAIAIAFFDRGISEMRKSKLGETASIISIAIYNKGNCYLLLHNNKLAMESFKEAVRMARTVDAKSLVAFGLKGSAKIYTLEGNYSEAIIALNRALNLASDVNDLILNQEIYKGLAENYLAINDWNQFKIYQGKFVEIQKLIKDRERLSVGESLIVKEAESKTNRSELSSKFYYLLLVLSLILTLIVLFFYIIIKRKNKEIAATKNQIYILQNKKGKEA
jgi:tetratricopeptide (TPR) repeat protein